MKVNAAMATPAQFRKKSALTGLVLAVSMVSHSVWAQDASSSKSVAGEALSGTSSKDLADSVIVVEGVKTKEQIGFKADKTRVGKVDQALKDVPQAVSVVTGQLMDDKNADSLKEALRNVAGITFNAGEGGRVGDNMNIRGYSAVGDLYLDNVRDYAQYNRETFNTEQVDVLKGSASMLYGRGSTGGVINQVSKKAQLVDSSEVNLTIGSYDYKRAVVDINEAITDTVAFRLNAMKTESESFREGVSQNRWGAAPSLTLGAGTDDEVTLSYFYLDENNVPDYGLPYFNGKPADIPMNRFYGLSNADYEKNKTGIATVSYNHLFRDDSSIKTVFRDAYYERDLRATAPRLVGNSKYLYDSRLLNRQRQARGGEEHQTTLQSDYATKFETGSLKHEVLFGVELVRESSNRWTNSNRIANPATTVGSTNTAPALSDAFYNGFTRTAPNSYKAMSYAAYLQDTIEVVPKFKVLTGLRYDYLKSDYVRSVGGDLGMNVGALSGRLGLMYQPSDFSTYYASYSTGFNSTAEAYQLDERLANTDPEKTRNIEVGAKWSILNDDLSIRTSLSRSEKTNERNTDLASADVYLLSGKRHTDALELEVAGRITSKWEVFFNYAYMRANIDNAAGTAANTKDKTPRNTPSSSGSLWTTYHLPYGFKVGAGAEYVARRYANDSNTTSVPGYVRADALLEYSVNKWLGVKLNVKNLFNRKYYEGIYQGHVIPGAPRTYEITLSAKF